MVVVGARGVRVIYGLAVPLPWYRGGQGASPLIAFAFVRIRPIEASLAKGRRRLVDRRGVPLEARGGCAASSEGRNPFGGGKAPPPEARKSTPRRPFSPSG